MYEIISGLSNEEVVKCREKYGSNEVVVKNKNTFFKLLLESLGDPVIRILLIVLAATDYFIQFRFHNKELRMSKQEIKDEYKQMEGDQQVKAKIKQKQRAMITQGMMNAVGDATVVITNPTHIAVAIKYEDGQNNAPKLVAKGIDHLAIRIKEKAKGK